MDIDYHPIKRSTTLVYPRFSIQTAGLWVGFALVLTLLLHFAVYRYHEVVLDVGTRFSSTLLTNFRGPEQAPVEYGKFSYQWSTAQSEIALPTNSAMWGLTLRGWQELTPPDKSVRVTVGDNALNLPRVAGVRQYHLLLPQSQTVTLATQDVANDNPDQIGLAVDFVHANKYTGSLTIEWSLVLFSVLTTAFLAFLIQVAELAGRDTALVLVGSAALLLLAFNGHAPYAFLVLPHAITLLAVTLLVASTVYYFVSMRFQLLPGYVVAALALVSVLKLVGILYPNYVGVDTSYHIRGVIESVQGDLFRVGGGQGQNFPYPPTVYLLLAPFLLFIPNPEWLDIQWLVLLGSVLIDSSTIILLYLVLKQQQIQESIRRWAVLLYVIIPAGFLLFWHATIAQNIGQWYGVLYIVALIYCINRQKPWSWFQAAALITLSFVANLGHFGVFLNLNLMFVFLVLVAPRFVWHYKYLIGTWFVGAGLSMLPYYSAFWSVIQAQSHNLTLATDNPGALRLFLLRRYVWELGIRDHYLGVYFALAVVTVLIVVIRRKQQPYSSLTTIFGTMLLTSVGLGLIQVVTLFNPTRYVIFGHTAVVIFSAFALTYLQRYKWGWAGTRTLAAATLLIAVSLWASGFALRVQWGWLQ